MTDTPRPFAELTRTVKSWSVGTLAVLLSLSATLGSLAEPNSPSFRRIHTVELAGLSSNARRLTAEILSCDQQGKTLAFTDSINQAVGFLDLEDPTNPKLTRVVECYGEPTSVVHWNDSVLVTVDQGALSGSLLVIDPKSGNIQKSLRLDGQPDCIATSPDKKYVVVAIENESPDKHPDGVPGSVIVFETSPILSEWSAKSVTLTGLADKNPEDPEPEFIAVNHGNLAAVTLQENNHIVLIDLPTASVKDHFSCGSVLFENADLSYDKRILFNQSQADVPREPDAVCWTPYGLATADEGDFEGGTRSLSLWSEQGQLLFSSGQDLSRIAANRGHFPDHRSHKRGVEPEGVCSARFSGEDYLFVGLEWANLLAIYGFKNGLPVFLQGLPVGEGPEGILAIPQRGLLVVASEVDRGPGSLGSVLTIFEHQNRAPQQQLSSRGLGWSGLSGLTSDPDDPSVFYSVNDKILKPSQIFKIKVDARGQSIESSVALSQRDGHPAELDLEGIAKSSRGGYWLVSEGSKKKPNLLLRANERGQIVEEYHLPLDVQKKRNKKGFEGVAELGPYVYVAFQGSWNPEKPQTTLIGRFHVLNKTWSFSSYPLESGCGLHGLASLGEQELAVLERDKLPGQAAQTKKVYRVSTDDWETSPRKKTLLIDLIGVYRELNIPIPDKPEGVAVDKAGQIWIINDNDGIKSSPGETNLIQISSKRLQKDKTFSD